MTREYADNEVPQDEDPLDGGDVYLLKRLTSVRLLEKSIEGYSKPSALLCDEELWVLPALRRLQDYKLVRREREGAWRVTRRGSAKLVEEALLSGPLSAEERERFFADFCEA